jgi:hypothetical protein
MGVVNQAFPGQCELGRTTGGRPGFGFARRDRRWTPGPDDSEDTWPSVPAEQIEAERRAIRDAVDGLLSGLTNQMAVARTYGKFSQPQQAVHLIILRLIGHFGANSWRSSFWRLRARSDGMLRIGRAAFVGWRFCTSRLYSLSMPGPSSQATWEESECVRRPAESSKLHF